MDCVDFLHQVKGIDGWSASQRFLKIFHDVDFLHALFAISGFQISFDHSFYKKFRLARLYENWAT